MSGDDRSQEAYRANQINSFQESQNRSTGQRHGSSNERPLKFSPTRGDFHGNRRLFDFGSPSSTTPSSGSQYNASNVHVQTPTSGGACNYVTQKAATGREDPGTEKLSQLQHRKDVLENSGARSKLTTTAGSPFEQGVQQQSLHKNVFEVDLDIDEVMKKNREKIRVARSKGPPRRPRPPPLSIERVARGDKENSYGGVGGCRKEVCCHDDDCLMDTDSTVRGFKEKTSYISDAVESTVQYCADKIKNMRDSFYPREGTYSEGLSRPSTSERACNDPRMRADFPRDVETANRFSPLGTDEMSNRLHEYRIDKASNYVVPTDRTRKGKDENKENLELQKAIRESIRSVNAGGCEHPHDEKPLEDEKSLGKLDLAKAIKESKMTARSHEMGKQAGDRSREVVQDPIPDEDDEQLQRAIEESKQNIGVRVIQSEQILDSTCENTTGFAYIDDDPACFANDENTNVSSTSGYNLRSRTVQSYAEYDTPTRPHRATNVTTKDMAPGLQLSDYRSPGVTDIELVITKDMQNRARHSDEVKEATSVVGARRMCSESMAEDPRPTFLDTAVTQANYLTTLDLYDEPLWPSYDPFQCPKCFEFVERMQGIVLKDCHVHYFCRDCIKAAIMKAVGPVECPLYKECRALMKNEELHAFRSQFGPLERRYKKKEEDWKKVTSGKKHHRK